MIIVIKIMDVTVEWAIVFPATGNNDQTRRVGREIRLRSFDARRTYGEKKMFRFTIRMWYYCVHRWIIVRLENDFIVLRRTPIVEIIPR